MSNSDHPPHPLAVEDRSGVSNARQFSPSAARNCGPIRDVLTRVLPKKGIVLERSAKPAFEAVGGLPMPNPCPIALSGDADARQAVDLEHDCVCRKVLTLLRERGRPLRQTSLGQATIRQGLPQTECQPGAITAIASAKPLHNPSRHWPHGGRGTHWFLRRNRYRHDVIGGRGARMGGEPVPHGPHSKATVKELWRAA
jgi:hypothetical protein